MVICPDCNWIKFGFFTLDFLVLLCYHAQIVLADCIVSCNCNASVVLSVITYVLHCFLSQSYSMITLNKAKYVLFNLLHLCIIFYCIFRKSLKNDVQSCEKVMATFFQMIFLNIYFPPNCIKCSSCKLEVFLNTYSYIFISVKSTEPSSFYGPVNISISRISGFSVDTKIYYTRIHISILRHHKSAKPPMIVVLYCPFTVCLRWNFWQASWPR